MLFSREAARFYLPPTQCIRSNPPHTALSTRILLFFLTVFALTGVAQCLTEVALHLPDAHPDRCGAVMLRAGSASP